MENQKPLPQGIMMNEEQLQRFFIAKIKQLTVALQFAEQQIKAGKAWDADCEKIIGEAISPTKLPDGFIDPDDEWQLLGGGPSA